MNWLRRNRLVFLMCGLLVAVGTFYAKPVDYLQGAVDAIVDGKTAGLQVYLEQGGDVNAIVPDANNYYTLLMLAIELGNDAAFDMLLAAGADPVREAALGVPLNLAVFQRNLRAVDRLLQDPRVLAGINKQYGTIKQTALFIAVINRDEEVVKKLRQFGALTTVPSIFDKTLDEECRKDIIPGCRFLL